MNSTLFVVWTMVASASLTLAAVHGILWLLDRQRLANLAFFVVALSVAAVARIEYGMMSTTTPDDYAGWLRWIHGANFLLVAGLVAFVHLQLGTARAWLGWTVIGLRAVVTAANMVSAGAATWQVLRLDQVPLLGEHAAASGLGTVRPLQFLATTTSILLAVYVLDAALTLWRKGQPQARRRAAVVGGGIAGFVLLATLQAQLVIWGVVQMPIMLSPPFLIMLAAMTYELCRDIIASARIETEARHLRDELAHVARVNTLGELSGSLAHELNQPLGAILHNAEAARLLLERDPPDLVELRAIVGDIQADDRRAGAIIERMRALLKRKSLELQQVSLQALVNEVLTLVRGDALARGVAVDARVPETLPPILADRVQLSQVLLNLLVNGIDAVSASSNGTRRVAIEARATDAHTIEVAVADSGNGILPDMLPKVFEPFVTTKPNGLGIGLAVSRTIVEAHGGRLWAQNVVTSGAVFTFTLPLVPAP